MAYEEKLETITCLAGSDLSAGQYKPVDIASDGQVDLVDTLGAKVLGILQDKPAAAARACSVGVEGISKCVAGAAVVIGTEVVVDATSRVITTSAADQYVLGTAMETAAAAGDIIAVKLKSYQRSA